jgi:drug/metabolite transporter (DMT)-like permease
MNKNTIDRKGLLHLFIVYIVWGSTYLAIRIAVKDGDGFSPFFLGASRATLAGLIMLTWQRLQNKSIRLTKPQFISLLVSGILLWLGGNGLVNLAEKRADSGTAALIVSSTPIWVATIESILDKKLPSRWLVLSLMLGTIGMVFLSLPVLLKGLRADILSVLVLICASLSWSIGTVYQTRNQTKLDSGVSSGYQLLFGGLALGVAAFVTGEGIPHPNLNAWLAWGSLLAFTSFVQVLRLLPTKLVTTYSYVNPVIAVFLGWLILGEVITIPTLIGAAFILLGVASVFKEHMTISH